MWNIFVLKYFTKLICLILSKMISSIDIYWSKTHTKRNFDFPKMFDLSYNTSSAIYLVKYVFQIIRDAAKKLNLSSGEIYNMLLDRLRICITRILNWSMAKTQTFNFRWFPKLTFRICCVNGFNYKTILGRRFSILTNAFLDILNTPILLSLIDIT